MKWTQLTLFDILEETTSKGETPWEQELILFLKTQSLQ